MPEEVKLNQLEKVLDRFQYPVARDEVAAQLDDVVLRYADGEEELPTVLDRVDDQEFDSRDELENSIYNALPTEAVGEPGQSEGEG
ncbi:DUF5789 family protein [Halomicrobium salinisoli]|uniref:DUF5789 family protein n=1 Tax=Halomicrobium salinisoli TaxID=2878391 RepID=UPI001CEFE296|nr:DUF5789 family protein [Halomicrobium salinisoli]